MKLTKNKKILAIIGIVVIAVVIIWIVKSRDNSDGPLLETKNSPGYSSKPVASPTPVADFKNGTYEIEGEKVTLVNGNFISASDEGAPTEITTQYFGNDAKGDLNGDGTEDVAFLVAQYGGGTGTFYYVLVALKTKDGYMGTNGVLIGDRIAPQTTEIRNGQLIVNYADRKPDEAFTEEPTVGMSKYLKISEGKLVEVVK